MPGHQRRRVTVWVSSKTLRQFWYQVAWSSHLTWPAAVGVQRPAVGEVCHTTVNIVGVWDVGGGLRLLKG